MLYGKDKNFRIAILWRPSQIKYFFILSHKQTCTWNNIYVDKNQKQRSSIIASKNNPIEEKLRRLRNKLMWLMRHDFVHIQVSEWQLCFVEKMKALELLCHGDQVKLYIYIYIYIYILTWRKGTKGWID